jgi:hypothetical protein
LRLNAASAEAVGWRSTNSPPTPANTVNERLANKMMFPARPTGTVAGALSSWGAGAMPIRPFVQSGAFEPEVVAAMSEAFDAACNEQPNVARGVIANRIIAAAKLGERDPVRLREAGLDKPD